jgi:chromosome partitioning protein
MAVIITIANEKGGVGKTTTAVNLAAGLSIALAHRPGNDNRVLLVDMDPQGHALLATAYGEHDVPAQQSLSALLIETPPPSIQRMLKPSIHHPNLFVIPSNRSAMVDAARTLPTLMANESRLTNVLSPIKNLFSFIIIDTPPTTGDLLVNALVAADHIIIPVEPSYLGVSGLRELQNTIEQVRLHFNTHINILGYLPTICEEQRIEVREILEQLEQRYPRQLLGPIHKASDLAYAHSSHMDIFTYKPPRQRQPGQLVSSSRATKEYGDLVETVINRTLTKKKSR